MPSNDSYFRMGFQHSVCQDYAISGDNVGEPFAILSDGCSGIVNSNIPGHPFTDFGSRFLVRSATKYLNEIDEYSFPDLKIFGNALSMARIAELPESSLDATLLVVKKNGPIIDVARAGDGVIIIKYKNGTVQYDSPKFGNNMPNYLHYNWKPEYRQAYVKEAKTVSYTTNIKNNGNWGVPTVEHEDMLEFLRANLYYYDTSDIEYILICSDGLESFQDANKKPIPLEIVIDQLTDFKSYAGKFITRRLETFLNKFCTENGWKHYDDLSVAGIYVGDLG